MLIPFFNRFLIPLTFLVSFEEDGLCFEDEHNVVWVWTLDFSRIFGAQELVSLVHLLEDVLHENKRERMVQTIMEVDNKVI